MWINLRRLNITKSRKTNGLSFNLNDAGSINKYFAECVPNIRNMRSVEAVAFYNSNRKCNFDTLLEFSLTDFEDVLKHINTMKSCSSG